MDEDNLFPIKDEGWPWCDGCTYADQIKYMKAHPHDYQDILDQLKEERK